LEKHIYLMIAILVVIYSFCLYLYETFFWLCSYIKKKKMTKGTNNVTKYN